MPSLNLTFVSIVWFIGLNQFAYSIPSELGLMTKLVKLFLCKWSNPNHRVALCGYRIPNLIVSCIIISLRQLRISSLVQFHPRLEWWLNCLFFICVSSTIRNDGSLLIQDLNIFCSIFIVSICRFKRGDWSHSIRDWNDDAIVWAVFGWVTQFETTVSSCVCFFLSLIQDVNIFCSIFIVSIWFEDHNKLTGPIPSEMGLATKLEGVILCE